MHEETQKVAAVVRKAIIMRNSERSESGTEREE